jgi:hypothetical protein
MDIRSLSAANCHTLLYRDSALRIPPPVSAAARRKRPTFARSASVHLPLNQRSRALALET